jgi:hypothetical protein
LLSLFVSNAGELVTPQDTIFLDHSNNIMDVIGMLHGRKNCNDDPNLKACSWTMDGVMDGGRPIPPADGGVGGEGSERL